MYQNGMTSGSRVLQAVLLAVAVFVLFGGQSAGFEVDSAASVVDSSTALPDSVGVAGGMIDPQLEGFELVNPMPEVVPFGEGEYLLFAIQYGLIYAGDATLEIRNIAVLDDTPTYHVVSTARTNKAFDIIYKVRDRHESFIDFEQLYSLRFEKHLREGKFKKDSKVIFDQVRHVAIWPDKEVGIPPRTHDFLSALYFARTLPIDVGQAVAMANHTSGRNYPIYVKVLRRERVSVPAGDFDCIVLEPVLQTTSIFESKGKLTIWVTDDTVRMPVLMRSKVIIGAFEAVLKEYRLSNEPHRMLIHGSATASDKTIR